MKVISALTDAELSAELTEARLTLESIRPYRFRQIESRLVSLRAEFIRRQQLTREVDELGILTLGR